MLIPQDRKNGSESFRPSQLNGQKNFLKLPFLLFFSSFKFPLNWREFPPTLLLLVTLFSCSEQPATIPNTKVSPQGNSDSNLIFTGVDLEQFDEVGRPLWKVKSKRAKYIKDKQVAQAENPDGELYQDGKVVYRIKGQKADIVQNGKQLVLKGKILATDPINGIVLRGNELEWLPQQGLLVVRKDFHCVHKQLQAVASEARVKTREKYAEFFGHVIADSSDPRLQIRTERLLWRFQAQKLSSDRPVQIDSYKNHQIVNRGTGNAADVDLKTKIATLKQNAQLVLSDPPIQVNSNSITWDQNNEVVTTNSLVHIFQKADKINITADRGKLLIPQNTAYFTGNVYAIGAHQQSLKSHQLTWYLKQKFLSAQGNVIYHQIDPKLNFQGETATGNLQTEDIIVKGGSTFGRVITVIMPQPVQKKK